LFAPRQGVIGKLMRRRLLVWRILSEDLIARLYKSEEREPGQSLTRAAARELLFADSLTVWLVVRYQAARGMIELEASTLRLTQPGKDRARALVRAHRLWEHYLSTEAGVSHQRLHDFAERLEHFTDLKMREKLQ